jgi:hypothetical protein
MGSFDNAEYKKAYGKALEGKSTRDFLDVFGNPLEGDDARNARLMGERDGTRDRLNNEKQLEMWRQAEAERESLSVLRSISNNYDTSKPKSSGLFDDIIVALAKCVAWILGILFFLNFLLSNEGRLMILAFVLFILGLGAAITLFEFIRDIILGKK